MFAGTARSLTRQLRQQTARLLNRRQDADDRLLRYARALHAKHGDDERVNEREQQAHPIDRGRMWIAVRERYQVCDCGAERRNLSEREVPRKCPPLGHMHAKVGVDSPLGSR